MLKTSRNSSAALLLPLILCLFFAFALVFGRVLAATTDTIAFQSKLVNSDGTNISNGTYNFRFRIYDAASGGTLLWSEDQSIVVSDGVVSARLGVTTPINNNVYSSPDQYLQVCFDANGTIGDSSDTNCDSISHRYEEVFTSRKPITAVPVALGARSLLDGLGGVYTYNSFFMQDGNAFGETAVLGTTDNEDLEFITNGTLGMTLTNEGNVGIGGITAPTGRLTIKDTASLATESASLFLNTDDSTFASDTGHWVEGGLGGGTWVISGGLAGFTPDYINPETLTLADTYFNSAPVAGKTYKISIVGNATSIDTYFTISFGGTDSDPIGTQPGNFWYDTLLEATTTAGLVITAQPGWQGTIDSIEVTEVTASSIALLIESNTGVGGVPFVIRSGGQDTANVYIGAFAGSFDSSGTDNVGLGVSALYSNLYGDRNTAVGTNTLAKMLDGTDNVGLGANSLSNFISGSENIGIGLAASQFQVGERNIFIGHSTEGAIESYSTIGIGNNLTIPDQSSSNILIGDDLDVNDISYNDGNYYNVLIGFELRTGDDDETTLAIGVGSEMDLDRISPIGIGHSSNINGDYALGVGSGIDIVGDYAVALGSYSSVSGDYGIALGSNSHSEFDDSIAVGRDAVTTNNNQLVIGGGNSGITEVIIGNGVTNEAPESFQLYATSGSGTDIAGGSIFIGAGAGTGAGVGGSISLATAAASTTGAGINTLYNRFTIQGNGKIGLGADTSTYQPVTNFDAFASTRITGSGNEVLTGSIDPTASTSVVGVGTLFTSELVAGDTILVSGDERVVVEIIDDLNLIVSEAFTDVANDTTPERLPSIFIARDWDDWGPKFVINYNGFVGIGTYNPRTSLSVNGGFAIQESSGPFHTEFIGGDQSGDITYTLPTSSSNGVLTNTGGVLSWAVGGGGISQVGSMTSATVFGDSTADDDWLGLGASAGRIEFDDQGTDEVNILSANVGIGTSTPTSFTLQVAGHIGPDANDTYDLGSDSLRFRDAYFGGDTLHIGTSTADEGVISYNTSTNVLGINTDSTTNGDIAFFSNVLYLDKSASAVGIGTTIPTARFDVQGLVTSGTLGTEYITAAADRDFSSSTGNWTGTGWSIGSGVITHTAGANALTLSNSALTAAPASGVVYQVSFSVNTSTPGSLNMTIGSATNSVNIGGEAGSENQVQVLVATGTGALTFTPDANWEGTLDNVSVKIITPASVVQNIRNSDGTVGLEIRAGGTGLFNTMLGLNAGVANVTGTRSTAIGQQSLLSNVSGSYNTAVGFQTLKYNTEGGGNTSVGAYSMRANTIGFDNSAFGMYVLNKNTSGTYNTALGTYALRESINGSQNTAVGTQALLNSISGDENTALGMNALYTATLGNRNTAVGHSAGYFITEGSNNVFLGYKSAENITTGSNNIVIGYDINVVSDTGSNQLNIGNFIFGTGFDGTDTTISNGYVGIGTVSPGQTLSVAGDFGIRESGTSPTYYTIFEGGDQSGDITYTLPTTSTNGVLTNTGGVLTWAAGGGGGIGQVGSMTSSTAFADATADDDWLGLGASAGRIVFDDQTVDFVNIMSAYVGIGSTTPTTVLDLQGTLTEAVGGGEEITDSDDRDFSASTGNWSGTNWSVTSGELVHTAAGANTVTLDAAALATPLAVGLAYEITFTVDTYTAGELVVDIGGSDNDTKVGTVPGIESYTFMQITTNDTDSLRFIPDGNWEGDIDDVSVRIITPSLAVQHIRNADGSIGLELRSGGTGTSNSFIGKSSGQYNDTGLNLTAFGSEALFGNTTGSNNVAVGTQALMNNGSGGANVAIGRSALKNNVVGSHNVAIGDNALASNTFTFYNTAVGSQSNRLNVSGGQNSSFGMQTLYNNVSGSENTAIGMNAMYTSVSGSYNTVLGANAGYDLNTGNSNVLIGTRAGDNLTSGSNNIVLGYDIDAPSNTASNQLNIGNFIFGTGIDGTGTTISNGKIGIGSNAPDHTLELIGDMAIVGNGYHIITGSIDPTASTTVTGVGTRFLKETDVGAMLKLTGTRVITGSIDPAASTAVTGVGTLFLTELKIGDQITVSGETRTVVAIASNTALTVGAAFSNNANDTSVDVISEEIRSIVRINSDTSLEVDRAFPNNDNDTSVEIFNHGFEVNGTAIFYGGAQFMGLSTPATPTVTPQGTTGASTWAYKITAVSENGRETIVSTAGTTTSGNATLTTSNFNRVTWSSVLGAIGYRVYRTTAATSPNTVGFIGYVGATSTLQFDDTGITPMGGTPNTIFNETSNVAVGTSARDALDTLSVDGRINQSWHYAFTDFFGGRANITANAVLNAGTEFGFAIIGTSGCTGSYPSVVNGVFRLTTGATAALGCQINMGTAGLPNVKQFDVSYNPVMEVVLNPGASTDKTILVGLTDASTATAAEPANGVYFYSSTAGTPSNQWVATNGRASAYTRQPTSTSTNSNTYQTLRIEVTSTSSRFYINGVLVADLATNIPSAGATLGPIISTSTTASAAKTVDVDAIELWQDDPDMSGMPGELDANYEASKIVANPNLYSDTTYMKGISDTVLPVGTLVSYSGLNEYDDFGKNKVVYDLVSGNATDNTILGISSGLLDPNSAPDASANPYAVAVYGPTYALIEEGSGDNLELGDSVGISTDHSGYLSKNGSGQIAKMLEPIDWSTVTEVVGNKKKKLAKVYVTAGADKNLVASAADTILADGWTEVDETTIQTPYKVIASSLLSTVGDFNVLKSRTLTVNDLFTVDDTGSVFATAVSTPTIKGVAGGITIEVLADDTFKVKVGEETAIEASVNGVKVNNLVVSDQQAGKITIPAGQTEITVASTLAKSSSIIIVTPTKVVTTAAESAEGSFVIRLGSALSEDVEIGWYIVNVSE